MEVNLGHWTIFKAPLFRELKSQKIDNLFELRISVSAKYYKKNLKSVFLSAKITNNKLTRKSESMKSKSLTKTR